MPALLVLLAVATALFATGGLARAVPRAARWQPALCLAGLGAALAARGTATLGGRWAPELAVDGLAAVLLAALFLLAASGAAPRSPALVGALAAALLAADALGLLLALAGALLLARARRRALVPLGALAAALLALGWHGALPELGFAALRTMPPPEGLRGAAVLGATLLAAWSLPAALPLIPGALVGLYLAARLLLDLAGPVTPGWWGVPTLAATAVGALLCARRAGAADDLDAANAATGGAVAGLAGAGVGVALLARGADLPPLAEMAVAAALLLVSSWAVWGSLLLLATAAIRAHSGGTTLAGLGGLLRRTPATGLALLIALGSMAALPVSAGFAADWLLLQALLAAGRAGGTAVLAAAAGALAAAGATLALLAAAALRLAGAALLGPPRSARAAAAAEPPRPARFGLAALAAAALAAGLAPNLLGWLQRPALPLLAGVRAGREAVWPFAGVADTRGYPAPVIAAVLAGGIGLAALSARAAGPGRGAVRAEAAAWHGGLPSGGQSSPPRLVPWPRARTAWRDGWPAGSPARAVVGALALALAAVLGWAAR